MKKILTVYGYVAVVMLGLIGVLFIGECTTSAVIGFVEGCTRMVDTCYSAGHQLGQYIAQ